MRHAAAAVAVMPPPMLMARRAARERCPRLRAVTQQDDDVASGGGMPRAILGESMPLRRRCAVNMRHARRCAARSATYVVNMPTAFADEFFPRQETAGNS